MTAELTTDDRGKKVVHGTERIGVVTDVRGGEAYVDPDWDHVNDDLAATLDWDAAGDTQTLEESAITAIRNSEVRLRDDLV
jgi:hypothetical protein